MSFIDNAIASVAAWVSGWHLEKIFKLIHDNSEKLWTKINPTVQDILKYSSAGVAIIQQGLHMAPQFVLDKIHDTIPIFDANRLAETLGKVSKVINIGVVADNPDLVTTVGNIQGIMKSMDSEDAKQYAENLANWIAFYNTPEETTLSVITNLMKFVFTTFVKGKYKVFG